MRRYDGLKWPTDQQKKYEQFDKKKIDDKYNDKNH